MPSSIDLANPRLLEISINLWRRHGRRYLLATALVLASSAVAKAQIASADSGAAWVAAGIGYADPGLAAIAEAWLRPSGWFVVGAQISNASQGGFDASKSTDVYSLAAGMRIPAGPLRLTVAAGRGEATSNQSGGQNGTWPLWIAAVDWPVSRHFAWHASRLAIVGGQRPYVLTTVGMAIGGVR